MFNQRNETKKGRESTKKKWLEQMGNGKDGTFCGKEKMQMSVYYSIGSILLGLAAWWIPYAARGKVRNFGGLSKCFFELLLLCGGAFSTVSGDSLPCAD